MVANSTDPIPGRAGWQSVLAGLQLGENRIGMAEPKWVRIRLGLACLDLDMHHRVRLG
jgi:hypothetical protein